MAHRTAAADPLPGPPTGRDPWSQVIGQERAVAQLRAAALAPVHAYLLVGPRGSGKRALARAFAAELLSEGLDESDADRARALALAEEHPDLVVVERVGAAISTEQASEIIRRAGLAPVEGSRKVLVLDEFDLIAPNVGPKLLKTVEEPPEGTYFIVIAEQVPADLVTIASRCVRIDLGTLPDSLVREALIADGVDPGAAAEAAASAAGDLGRARLLAGDPQLAFRRAFWHGVPDRLDGTGARATELVDELLALVDAAQAPLDARHATELAEVEQRAEQFGERGAGRRPLAERQKREVRRHHADELGFGLMVLARRYRDALASERDPAPVIAALQAIQLVAGSLRRTPTERLQLLALFIKLPTLAGDGRSSPADHEPSPGPDPGHDSDA